MLTNEQFEAWYHKLQLSKSTIDLITQVRSSEPSRKVKSSAANVSGAYCSKKMGLTMQFESHKVELPLIVTLMESNPDVLEYYDQPGTIKLIYNGKSGKKLGFLYTPDLFVIRADSAGYEEYKTEKELEKLSRDSHERYFKDENGIWRCPPGERYAAQYGLYFKVRSSSEINWSLYRNLEYLCDYNRNNYSVSEAAKNNILALVYTDEGITYKDIVGNRGSFSVDDLNVMLAYGELYFNIQRDCFDDPGNLKIYTSEKVASMLEGTTGLEQRNLLSQQVEIAVGKIINWDGIVYEIVNVGEHRVTLLSDEKKLLSLDLDQIQHLLSTSQIEIVNHNKESSLTKISEIIGLASPKDIETANKHASIVMEYLYGDKSKITASHRTVRDWVQKYKIAEQTFGQGYIGLIPKHKKKGNELPRMLPKVIEIIRETIKNHYENNIQTKKSLAYGFLRNSCAENGCTPPSYQTFCTYVNNYSTMYEQTYRRQGSRAAYDYQEFYWELERTTPKHGVRPFEFAHIDHTEIDLELTYPAGRPWATIMSDAFTRRIIALYITMDPPSYRSNMMVIRECVRRFNRLPQTIIVDGGKDFNSLYFDQLLARYEVNKKVRPKAKSRFGSVCERLFGTSNTELIHNLAGNTQLTKQVRKVTKAFNPRNLATWDLFSFNELFKLWAYDFYDTDEHPALGESPRDAFIRGFEFTGNRSNLLIPYDRNFEFATLPTTPKKNAKIFAGRGFKLKSIYYWADSFRIPENEGKSVPIRYDPWNIGKAYAFLKGNWIECISEYFTIFNGKTEKELQIASAEIRKKMSNGNKKFIVSAAKLAKFFKENVRTKEKELAEMKNANCTPNLHVVKDKRRLSNIKKYFPDKGRDDIKREIYEEY